LGNKPGFLQPKRRREGEKILNVKKWEAKYGDDEAEQEMGEAAGCSLQLLW
jgi:hypothetical protein